ncbi:MAG: WG repeat-containing protein [Cytophagales bacterium]
MKLILLLALQIFISATILSQNKTLLLPIKSNYKWGYCDMNGKVVIEPQFDYAENFVCKLAKIKTKGKYGILDSTGRLIIEPKEEAINIFCPHYISVKEDSAWGLDDADGNKLIAPRFDKIELWKEDLFLLKKNNLVGLFDAKTKTLIEPEFTSINRYGNYYLVNKLGKQGVLDKSLKTQIQPEYVGLEILDSSTVLLKERDFWAVVHSFGVNITKFDYMAFKKLDDDFIMLKAKVGGWHLFSLKLKKIITSEPHENYALLDENLILTTKFNRHGVLDNNGKTILGLYFTNIHKNEDFLLVEKDTKWGLASVDGKFVIETVHDRLFPFKQNVAVFEAPTGKGVINNAGKILVSPLYKEIDIRDNMAYCKDGNDKITTAALDGKSKKSTNSPKIVKTTLPKNNTKSVHTWLRGNGRKYGLVGHDTVYVPFNFDEVVQKGEYALAGIKVDYRNNPRMYGFLNQQKLIDLATLKYDLVNNNTGKVLHQGTNIWYYRIADFQTGDYAKMIYEGGLQALISKQGKIMQEYSFQSKEKKMLRQPFNYIGSFSEGIAPYSIGGTMNYAGDWESARTTGGKWGYVDQDGKFISDPKFDEAGPFINGRAIVKTRGLYGVIDELGKYVIDPIHASISFLENSNYKFLKIETKKDRFGLIDTVGKLLTPIAFDKIFPYKDGLARVMTNGKFGFIDENQKMVVPAIYDNALDFSEGMAAISLGKLWGFIDKDGVQQIIPMSPMVGRYKNGIAPASKDGKMTYINKDGRLIIVPKFVLATEFSNELAIVSSDGKKKGLIDTKGKEAVPEIYDDIQFLSKNDLAKVKEDGEWKLFNLKLKKVISKKSFLDIGEFNDGLALVKSDKYYNFIDTSGKIIINKKFLFASPFSNGLARVGLEIKTGFINPKGNTVINFSLGNTTDFNSNHAFTQIDNKLWAILDKNGKIITSAMFTNPKPFSDGFSLMGSGKEYYFIDTLGQNIFKEKFELAYPFEYKVARVKSTRWGLLSTNGYHYVENKFDYISEYKDKQAVVGLYNSVGIADLNGSFIIEPSFDSVYGISETLFRAEQSDAVGYIKDDRSYLWDLKK